MLKSLASLLGRLRSRLRSGIGIAALFAIALGGGIAAYVDSKQNDSFLSAAGISQAAARVSSGMGINQFLAAVRTMRILPGERKWWHRKGDKAAAPKAFTAIAPPEDKVSEVAPPIVSPAAFSAIAPDGVPAGSDLLPASDIPQSLALPTPGGPGGGGPIITRNPPDVPPLGVPEPASWAMMIIGFGLIGARMRWRRIRETAKAEALIIHR